MSQVAELGNPEPKRIKLRRINNNKDDIIQKNLEPLIENIKKKKRAQQAYYANQDVSGVSPLIRDFKKQPVHQRLGRTVPLMLGTNTSAVPPKRRLRFPGNQINRKTRVFTAQQRLNMIRARNRDVLNMQYGTVPKRIKLRRMVPQTINGPTNLTVEVKNNNALGYRHQIGNCACKFRPILNSQLQQEIRKIQMAYQGGQTVAPIRITPCATEIPLNKRFAELL